MKPNYLTIYIQILCMASLCYLGAGCKKFVAVDPPDDQLVSASVFNNDQTATATVVGIYSRIMQINKFFLNGANTLYPALSSDELVRTSPFANEDAFSSDALPATNQVIKNDLWRFAYNYIYAANASIEGIGQSKALTPALQKSLLGEAKFLRALSYFYLVNLYGDIPLITTTDYRITASLGRTPVAQVYEQIVKDLEEAQATLPLTTGNTRPGQMAATALLARVDLYQGKYAQAEVEASRIINSGTYTLEPNLDRVFLINSRETIFQLLPVSPDYNTAEGNFFIPLSLPTSKPTYVLTPFLSGAFEAGDGRRIHWVSDKTIGGVVYAYPAKYKQRINTPSGNAPVEANIVLRFAEQYLIRSEARAEQDNLSGALEDLNSIRFRAGLPPANASSKSALLDLILHERQIELFAEWGHRFLDLKRIGKIDAILGSEKSSVWKSTAALYPVPLSEIQSNPNLTQNPGY